MTPLAALQVSSTKSYADKLKQVTEMRLFDDERTTVGCEEPEISEYHRYAVVGETGENSEDELEARSCLKHDSPCKHKPLAISVECREKLKKDEEHTSCSMGCYSRPGG